MNKLRPEVDKEPKTAGDIHRACPHGWAAVQAVLVSAARQLAGGATDLTLIARRALDEVTSSGFVSSPDRKRSRFCSLPIMAWQDALYVMNEQPEWRFPDNVLCVGWIVECGGPATGRGPARADFSCDVSLYIQGTRAHYNAGAHGNGPGWPPSRRYEPRDCRHMM
jgi:hypothetical protein